MKRILITIAAALALVPTLGAQESTWKNTEPELKPEVFELLNLNAPGLASVIKAVTTMPQRLPFWTITATARASAHRK